MAMKDFLPASAFNRTIDNYAGKDGFPAPLHLTARRIAFLESEIDAWLEKLLAKREYQKATPKATARTETAMIKR